MTSMTLPKANFDCSLEDGFVVTFAHRAGEKVILLISLTNPSVLLYLSCIKQKPYRSLYGTGACRF